MAEERRNSPPLVTSGSSMRQTTSPSEMTPSVLPESAENIIRSPVRGESSDTRSTRPSITATVGEQSRRQQQPNPPSDQAGPSSSTAAGSSSSLRMPPNPRRQSATKQPKSKEFSVDDAREEVTEASQRHVRHATGSSRNPSSTVRRRQGYQQRLPTLESTELEDSTQADDGFVQSKINERRNSSEEEGTLQADPVAQDENEDSGISGGSIDADAEDADLSDSESFTLKDRQDAINETHPFGIRIWKPALYKKSRSVEKGAEGDIHSAPGGMVPGWLKFFNFLWTLIFGWWLALVAGTGGCLCHLFAFAPGCKEYGRVLLGLAAYIFYPFGKYVKLIQEDAYAEEDHGEGRSITEYEQWQSGDIEEGRLFFGPVRSLVGQKRSDVDSEDEEEPLLGRTQAEPQNGDQRTKAKKRLFGRGQWSLGRVIFFIFFYGGLTPSLFLVSGICWLLIYSVPMARVTYLLFSHLRRRPLSLEFHSAATDTRERGAPPSSILLCTYRAVGTKYWKYTIGGTNIFLINTLSIVAFTIFDYWILCVLLGVEVGITNPIFMFILALISIIPLAYFIGQAVASISAQSTMGVGAAVNAFFSTVVEVFLYCIALKDGKSSLVEGAVIGSVFAGILALPGLSMCFGALKRKTQRFNVKSAGVTSTMLLFATIGTFGPTLFYQIYGSHELNCHDCSDDDGNPLDRDCRRCYFAQIPALNDPFFVKAVRPFTWVAAVLLFLSYIIGLFFTLRTHAATIWESELDEKRHENLPHAKNLGLKKVITNDYGSITSPRLTSQNTVPTDPNRKSIDSDMDMASHKTRAQDTRPLPSGETSKQNSGSSNRKQQISAKSNVTRRQQVSAEQQPLDHVASGGGHDAPNWGRAQSYTILLSATVAYAVIAEILVNTVDSVLQNSDIDEKFLGITVFALVPNATEFLNAISFAVNGNIALSMEIGSAYALQVLLLQIPALVLFSGIFINVTHIAPIDVSDYTFSLIFPQWDMVAVILCVFLLSYMYGEGKSNYFKGSILILSYLVVVVGFYLAKFDDEGFVLDPNKPGYKKPSMTIRMRKGMRSGRSMGAL